MGTSITDTIGRWWIAGFAPVFLLGAYEFWTDGSGWSKVLAVPMVVGALATGSYLIPRKQSKCESCGAESAGGRFCSACGKPLV
ncbi:MAG TPA: hypothetical protein VM143_06910 [Acidimicrobiales bacterium]|nr:hypothetical protein [Acidimicrobiales bacterium]